MIVRVALLLLLFLAVLAGLRLLRRIGQPPAPPPIEAARRCPDCEAWVVEPCARPDCRFRPA